MYALRECAEGIGSGSALVEGAPEAMPVGVIVTLGLPLAKNCLGKGEVGSLTYNLPLAKGKLLVRLPTGYSYRAHSRKVIP